MKISTYLIVSLLATLGVVTLAFVSHDTNQKDGSLMTILQSILTDQEFLALSKHQQLKILIKIYDMLENHFKRKYS
jgi:hypothetical protein